MIPLVKKAELLAMAGVVPTGLVDAVGAALATVEAELRPVPVSVTQAEVAAELACDLTGFRTAWTGLWSSTCRRPSRQRSRIRHTPVWPR